MNEERLLKLPDSEWLPWLRLIKSTPGPLSAEHVLVVKTWLKKTLSAEQLQQYLHNWTGEMVVAPLGDTDMMVVYMLTTDGGRRGVTTSVGTRGMATRVETHAFRQAIAPQTHEFRQQWQQDPLQDKVCGHCKCALDGDDVQSQVDHVNVPFRDLLKQFREQENLVLQPVAVQREKLDTGAECWMLQDLHLRQRWQDFHRHHAQLRMLCKPCNIGPCNTARPAKKLKSDEKDAATGADGCTSAATVTEPAKKKQKKKYSPPLFLTCAL